MAIFNTVYQKVIAGGGGEPGDITFDSLEITSPPTVTQYVQGEQFNAKGMEVVASFSNGVSLIVPNDELTFSPALGTELTVDTTSIHISFSWDVNTITVSQVITVSDKTNVFGVAWNYSSSNTSSALMRLTPDNDPNHLCTVEVTSNPVPAVGNGTGSSPFDNYLPWAGMEEYNIINNEVSFKRGVDDLFSREIYDTVVYIPEFYYMVVDNPQAETRYFYVSDKPTEGLEKHPGSGNYVGRYDTCVTNIDPSTYRSVSGFVPKVSVTRAQMREASHAKGSKWWLLDVATWNTWWLLFIIEFANWDSQSVINVGITSDSAAHVSGETDSMVYHTGAAAGTAGKQAIQYRHIENPWGNVFQFVDGFVAQDKEAWVGLDNASFGDTTAGLTDTGLSMSGMTNNTFTSKLGLSSTAKWAFVPIAGQSNDSDSTIKDKAWNSTDTRILYVGGGYSTTAPASGLCAIDANNGATRTNTNIGGRLLYRP